MVVPCMSIVTSGLTSRPEMGHLVLSAANAKVARTNDELGQYDQAGHVNRHEVILLLSYIENTRW